MLELTGQEGVITLKVGQKATKGRREAGEGVYLNSQSYCESLKVTPCSTEKEGGGARAWVRLSKIP